VQNENESVRRPPEVSRHIPVNAPIWEKLRSAPVTTLLIAVNAIVFLAAEHHGSTLKVSTLLAFGASEQVHVRAGEYWRLLTPMFLHIGWAHFLMNSYFGFGWCSAVERAAGPWRFLLVYLVSGIGGSAASVAFSHSVSAGASGAVFGIVGATLVLRRRMLPSWRAAQEDRAIRSIVVTAGVWMALGFAHVLPMDNSAHLGGLVVGGITTWLLTTRPAPRALWAVSGLGFSGLLVYAISPGWPHPGQAKDLFEMAYYYYEGKSFGSDDARAAKFALRACNADSADACGLVGLLEYQGRGMPADRPAGEQRIREACRKGSSWSCKMLQGER
jgi:rhomboid protease GluP